MRNRFLRVIAALAATGMAFLLVGALTLLMTPGEGTPGASAIPGVQAEALNAPARRAISIPFGISSFITVTGDGEQLLVTGHGVCWDEGQMFDLRVRVAQSMTNAYAEGRSIDICAGGDRQMWSAATATGSQEAFASGPARACAEAIEFAKHGIADEYRWCKDIELIQTN